jgi:hypothetical protein
MEIGLQLDETRTSQQWTSLGLQLRNHEEAKLLVEG